MVNHNYAMLWKFTVDTVAFHVTCKEPCKLSDIHTELIAPVEYPGELYISRNGTIENIPNNDSTQSTETRPAEASTNCNENANLHHIIVFDSLAGETENLFEFFASLLYQFENQKLEKQNAKPGKMLIDDVMVSKIELLVTSNRVGNLTFIEKALREATGLMWSVEKAPALPPSPIISSENATNASYSHERPHGNGNSNDQQNPPTEYISSKLRPQNDPSFPRGTQHIFTATLKDENCTIVHAALKFFDDEQFPYDYTPSNEINSKSTTDLVKGSFKNHQLFASTLVIGSMVFQNIVQFVLEELGSCLDYLKEQKNIEYYPNIEYVHHSQTGGGIDAAIIVLTKINMIIILSPIFMVVYYYIWRLWY